MSAGEHAGDIAGSGTEKKCGQRVSKVDHYQRLEAEGRMDIDRFLEEERALAEDKYKGFFSGSDDDDHGSISGSSSHASQHSSHDRSNEHEKTGHPMTSDR